MIALTFDKPGVHGGLVFRQAVTVMGERPQTQVLIAADIPDGETVGWQIHMYVPSDVSLRTDTVGVNISNAGSDTSVSWQNDWYSFNDTDYLIAGSLVGPRTDATALANTGATPTDSSKPRDVSSANLLWNGPSLAIKDGPYVAITGPQMLFHQGIANGQASIYSPVSLVGREEFRPGSDPTRFATQSGSSPSVINDTTWSWALGSDGVGPRSIQTDFGLLATDQQMQFLAGLLLGVSGGAFVGAIQTVGTELADRKMRSKPT